MFLNRYMKMVPKEGLMSQTTLKELKRLLKPDVRTNEEWDRIEKIMKDSTVVTPIPKHRMKQFETKNHILCQKKNLIVFTNAKDCARYLRRMCLKSKTDFNQFRVETRSFHSVIETARWSGLWVIIDSPSVMKVKDFIFYYSPEKDNYYKIRVEKIERTQD